jgi:hypothetical protein
MHGTENKCVGRHLVSLTTYVKGLIVLLEDTSDAAPTHPHNIMPSPHLCKSIRPRLCALKVLS